MLNIRVPSQQFLEYYLSEEKVIAQECVEPCFFTWIVSPTVIYGKHQIKEQEMDVSFCKSHNIRIVQRESGGGCVYADEGNLMISMIIPSTHSERVFSSLMGMLAAGLVELGYPAVATEHNDILICGSKVSGSACYLCYGKTIVHSTMLYNVNFEMLQKAITPSRDKLAKHAVQSVRQRVCNLVDIKDLGAISDFRNLIEDYLIRCIPSY